MPVPVSQIEIILRACSQSVEGCGQVTVAVSCGKRGKYDIMTMDPVHTKIVSARPVVTADLMARTGLDDQILTRLVHRFYDRIRSDPMLGPVFAERITDWGPHLARMVEFWSSVALMTGRYHGQPMPKHLPLPIESEHFDRWLALFRQTADEVCPPCWCHQLPGSRKPPDCRFQSAA
jgi:hemoglobin